MARRAFILHILAITAAGLLLAAALIHFLRLNLWDTDFWFHVSSGRYILSERHLPQHDPFSYPLQMDENRNAFPEHERFILRQYWIAQIIFYKIFDTAGATGIIICRSLLLVLTLAVVLLHQLKHGVRPPVAVLFTYLLYLVSTRSSGERPVLFSFLLTAIVFVILDRERETRSRSFFLLPLIMALWANMHGGFIAGNITILAFMGGAAFERMISPGNKPARDFPVFMGVCAVAVMCSLINPNGWNGFLAAFSSKYRIFFEGIQEWQSPFTLYFKKMRPLDYPYLIVATFTILLVVLRNRRLVPAHMLLLAGFFFMSAQSTRFVFFYSIIAVMIIGPEYDRILTRLSDKLFPSHLKTKIDTALLVLVLCGTLAFFSREATAGRIPFGMAVNNSVPERAVDFIENNDITGNMFNDYGYGGYLTWRLYPGRMNFIDSRALNYSVMLEYGWIQNAVEHDPRVAPSRLGTPLWKRLLNHYQVNYILVSPTDIYGRVTPLVMALLDNSEWTPIYLDRISIIYSRNTAPNRTLIERHGIPGSAMYDFLIYEVATRAMHDESSPQHLITLGELFRKSGRIDDAVKAYKHAERRFPDNIMIKQQLEQLEYALKSKKTN